MKLYFLVFLFLVVMPLSHAGDVDNLSREARELLMGEQAILSSLLRAKANVPRSPIMDLGPDKAELGLALIGARNSSASQVSLARLMRYQMDGALSEDYTCYVLGKGKSFIRILQNINSKNLDVVCRAEVRNLTVSLATFTDFNADLICKNGRQIQKDILEYAKELKKGTRCDPEDF